MPFRIRSFAAAAKLPIISRVSDRMMFKSMEMEDGRGWKRMGDNGGVLRWARHDESSVFERGRAMRRKRGIQSKHVSIQAHVAAHLDIPKHHHLVSRARPQVHIVSRVLDLEDGGLVPLEYGIVVAIAIDIPTAKARRKHHWICAARHVRMCASCVCTCVKRLNL